MMKVKEHPEYLRPLCIDCELSLSQQAIRGILADPLLSHLLFIALPETLLNDRALHHALVILQFGD